MSKFDLEAIEKRHAAGSPAKEDMEDLIAEVKRLTAERKPNSTSNPPSAPKGGLTVGNESLKQKTEDAKDEGKETPKNSN